MVLTRKMRTARLHDRHGREIRGAMARNPSGVWALGFVSLLMDVLRDDPRAATRLSRHSSRHSTLTVESLRVSRKQPHRS